MMKYLVHETCSQLMMKALVYVLESFYRCSRSVDDLTTILMIITLTGFRRQLDYKMHLSVDLDNMLS